MVCVWPMQVYTNEGSKIGSRNGSRIRLRMRSNSMSNHVKLILIYEAINLALLYARYV